MCFPITAHIEKFSSYSSYLLPCNPWMVINKSSNYHAGLKHFCPFISRHREMIILKFHDFFGDFDFTCFQLSYISCEIFTSFILKYMILLMQL